MQLSQGYPMTQASRFCSLFDDNMDNSGKNNALPIDLVSTTCSHSLGYSDPTICLVDLILSASFTPGYLSMCILARLIIKRMIKSLKCDRIKKITSFLSSNACTILIISHWLFLLNPAYGSPYNAIFHNG